MYRPFISFLRSTESGRLKNYGCAKSLCICAEYAEKSLELIDNDVNNVNIASRANDLILSLLIFLFMHLFFTFYYFTVKMIFVQ